jgi:hypothetical protein
MNRQTVLTRAYKHLSTYRNNERKRGSQRSVRSADEYYVYCNFDLETEVRVTFTQVTDSQSITNKLEKIVFASVSFL